MSTNVKRTRGAKLPIVSLLFLSLSVVISVLSLERVSAAASGSSNWLFRNEALERESGPPYVTGGQQRLLRSPAEIARQASRYFNGRVASSANNNNEALSSSTSFDPNTNLQDLFQCLEPTKEQFTTFSRLFNRTFPSGSEEELDRLSLFLTTMRRIILFNRIVQNDITNSTNYDSKPEIKNYHFIVPAGAMNVPLWYADITDCELGLIKRVVFDIFHWIDQNQMSRAYKLALDNSEYLPLLTGEGFEQLANILLVRLFDRFRGDQMMNQLFEWPLYLKKLAAYAYNRRQSAQKDFQAKMPLIAFAYPTYFRDLKYNPPAVNRTGDNIGALNEHDRFNRLYNRKFTSRQERAKRLSIYRQRVVLLNLLNDEEERRWQNASQGDIIDWTKAQVAEDLAAQNQYKYHQANQQNRVVVSEKLRLQRPDFLSSSSSSLGGDFNDDNNESPPLKYKPTRFTDLTDSEFVAYLTNDFGLLENSTASVEYIDANFPITPLDDRYRNELARELELRRLVNANTLKNANPLTSINNNNDSTPTERPSLTLARKVIDELISDVGLPIGSVFVEAREQEHYSVFGKLVEFFSKFYGQSNSADAINERQKRYEQFKENYGRFRAWWAKEGWLQMDQSQTLGLLRLSDMSWQEIKLTLFKICCLTDDNLARLSNFNSTIKYLGSNDFLCQSISGSDLETAQDNQRTTQSELAALELYYYYCVHFNKHHLNLHDFHRRLAIFRRNIDQIRQHSCTRGLTTLYSLAWKKTDTLSSIDTLDPRKSYTDDLNLDRYDFFDARLAASGSLTGLNEPLPAQSQSSSPSDSDTLAAVAGRLSPNSGGDSYNTRAGISYRRELFANLVDQTKSSQFQSSSRPPNQPGYPETLTLAGQNLELQAKRYKRNQAHKIYALVVERYRHCMRLLRNQDPGPNVRQECQSIGRLEDKSAPLLSNTLAKLQQQPSTRIQQGNSCSMYWQGLEPWSSGLIPQDSYSPQLIFMAKCNAIV